MNYDLRLEGKNSNHDIAAKAIIDDEIELVHVALVFAQGKKP